MLARGEVLTRLCTTASAETFIDTSMPVVDYYRKQDKVVDVSLHLACARTWRCGDR